MPLNPRNAGYILREHTIAPDLFLEMKVELQIALIERMINRKATGLYTLQEFRNGAAALVREDKRRQRKGEA